MPPLFSLGVLSSLTGTGADFDCPSGWSAYDRYCYKPFNEPQNWDDAEEPLKRSSGTLKESLQEVIKFSLFYPDFLKWDYTDCQAKKPFVCKFPPEC
ncbi:hypothetical protein Chor_008162 [Crotalus horridus]